MIDRKIEKQISRLRLSILTFPGMFGIDEIIQKKPKREKTVECVSREGECLFLSTQDFFHVINTFKFRKLVVDESMQRDRSYNLRMTQTQDFQRTFYNRQRDILNMLDARDKAINEKE